MRIMCWMCLISFAVFLAACSAYTLEVPGAAAPTATPAESELRASAELTAKTFLALALGLTTDDVHTVSIEPVDWPSGCLGLTRAGLACSPAVTPGYRFILEAQGQRFEYHTNADGSAYVPIDPVYVPAVAMAVAKRTLAAQISLSEDALNVVRVNMVAWADTCLGLVQINDVCISQTTYGYDIVLEAQTKNYEFHITDDGQTIRQVP